MMKKICSGFILFSFLIAGCVKKDTTKCAYNDSNVVAPASEIDSLQQILTDSGIIASPNPSGFFYKITTPGAGAGITNLCSVLTVTYKGSFFNGQVFDSTRIDSTVNPPRLVPANFQLGQVIPGWQKGLPLISKGGEITLYIPPTLAYGAQGYGSIPPNSYIIFDIHIVDIQ